MSPAVAFFALFGATLVLLIAVLVTGRAARRRAHLVLVALTVSALGATIWQAYRLGETVDLESAGWITPVHMLLARSATLSFVPTALLGLLTLRDGRRRRWHGRLAWLSFGLSVMAAVTGVWMLVLAEPR